MNSTGFEQDLTGFERIRHDLIGQKRKGQKRQDRTGRKNFEMTQRMKSVKAIIELQQTLSDS